MLDGTTHAELKGIFQQYKDMIDDPTVPQGIKTNLLAIKEIIIHEPVKPTRRTM